MRPIDGASRCAVWSFTIDETDSPGPAALPWYDFAETRADLDAIWTAVVQQLTNPLAGEPSEGGFALPPTLDRVTPLTELLGDPRLTLSQCCGLDLFYPHTQSVEPIAVPVISGLNVAPGYYRSVIVTRDEPGPLNPRVAVNDPCSHSGHTAVRGWLRGTGVRDYRIVVTGSHAASITAVCAADADIAAVDALSWRHLQSPTTAGLVIVGHSEPAPAPPFVVGRESSVDRPLLVSALNAAFARFGRSLGISGVRPTTRDAYEPIRQSADACGVPSLVSDRGDR